MTCLRKVCLLALATAVLITACARPVPVALPVPRAAALEVRGDSKVYDDILETGCNIFQVTARLTLRGRVAGKRPRPVIWVASAGTAFRLEASGGERPFLLTSATASSAQVATLRLPDGRLVESTDVAALVQLATGLPLSGGELQRLLTTCPTRDGGGPVSYRPNPDALDLILGDVPDTADVLHFARDDAGANWRLLAMTSTRQASSLRWRTEFHAPVATVPRTFRLTSLDWKGQPGGEFDVLVAVDHAQVSPMIEPRLFEPARAPGERMTLDGLKTSGVRLPLLVD